jgi:hypothetical protein
MKPRLRRLIWIAPAAIVAMAILIFIGGGIVQLLWNWLLPPLFGWRSVTFWQAIGLLALCRILFGGVEGRGLRRSGWRRRVDARWDRLTLEEREKFREAMRRRWGGDVSGTEPTS